jgi:hypothetical protein
MASAAMEEGARGAAGVGAEVGGKGDATAGTDETPGCGAATLDGSGRCVQGSQG